MQLWYKNRTFNPILVWFYREKPKPSALRPQKTFNPILVWFYHVPNRKTYKVLRSLSIPFWSDFILPSSSETLTCSILSIPFWSDFIPSFSIPSSFTCLTFQSHFGLILSCSSISYCEPLQSLSIPFWSDFISRNSDWKSKESSGLSIPFWSDFIRKSSRCRGKGSCLLSIPFWSDFIMLSKSFSPNPM